MSRGSSLLWCGGLLSLLAGCSLVSSVHPLSDETTSIADDRLIGEWIVVDPKKEAAEADPAPEPPEENRIHFRRLAGESAAYEALNPQNEDEDDTSTLLATQIGDRHLLSVRGNKPSDEPVRYLLMQYRFASKDELHFFWIDPERAAMAVQQGRIEGTIQRESKPDDDPNDVRRPTTVVFTSPTGKLREFFATKQGQALFHTDEPVLILKRPGE